MPSAPTTAGFAESLVRQALAGHHDDVNETLHNRRREYLRLRRDLADVVGWERLIRGVTRRQLAAMAGVPVKFVARIERAEPVDSLASVRRVLRAIEVEPPALPEMATRPRSSEC